MKLTSLRAALILFVLACASARASGLSVEGQVLGPDGQGLAGARVELRPVLRVYEQGMRDLEGKGEPEPAARTVTGTDGWYRLQCPGMGAWRVTVAAEGFVPRDSGPMILYAETNLDILQMEAGADFTLRVVGENGRPLAGVRVASAAWGADSHGWLQARRLGTTGADGTLRLLRAAKETLRLSLLAPGYPIRRAVSSGAGPLVLRLERGRRWSLGVYDGGKTVPGALIRDLESGLLIGRTSAAGWLVADAPNTGDREVQVEVRDGRLGPYRITPPSAKDQTNAERYRLLLVAPATLVGRVVDQRTGRPVAGAVIWPVTDPAAFVTADVTGSYRLPAWASPTGVWLRAMAEGYFQEQEPVLPEGVEVVPPVFALWPAESLAGTVVDERDQPVPDAEVRVFQYSIQKELREVGRARTSSRGSFRFPYLSRGRSYDLLAVRSGLAPARASVTLAEDEQTVSDVRLVLGPARSAGGRVVDPEGQPVSGATVEFVRSLAAESLGEDGILADDGLYRTGTGSDGSFHLADLPAGWFDLEVRRPGFVPLTSSGVEMRPDDSVADLGTLVLTPGKRLEGRATEPGGAPVAGAEVWVVPDIEAGARAWKAFLAAGPATVTDPDGRFVLQSLDPRQALSVDICRPGYQTGRIWQPVLEEGPVQVTPVTLSRAARLAGRVVDPGGKPVSGASVSASLAGASLGDWFPPTSPCPQSGQFSTAETDAEGRFTLEPLEEGFFELRISAEGYLSADLPGVEVKVGLESAGPTLVLERGAVLTEKVPVAQKNPIGRRARGRIVDPDGNPVPGALVDTPEDPFIGSAYTAADGSFSLEVDEGAFVLLARKPGYGPVRLDHGATAGDVEGLELRLGKAASLSGRIVGVAPEDLARVKVMALNDRYFERQGVIALDGTYRILDLTLGGWTVGVRFQDRSSEVRVEIVEGDENLSIDLYLPAVSEEP
jgi:hypothetical protein